jgi:hypothetical protein
VLEHGSNSLAPSNSAEAFGRLSEGFSSRGRHLSSRSFLILLKKFISQSRDYSRQ